MKKFITPRGGGRTYEICKYAIENDCDIIVPIISNVGYIIKTIKSLCESSHGRWAYKGYDANPREVHVSTEEKHLVIRVFVASNFQLVNFGFDSKQVVIDDVDLCMQYFIGHHNIAAVSVGTYNPCDVGLTQEITEHDNQDIGRPLPQLTCRSLL